MQLKEDAEDALNSLSWLLAMGVDDVIDDRPVNRFALPQPKPTSTTDKRQATGPRPISASKSSGSADEASIIAEQCNSLDELKSALEEFEGCALKQTATHLVFADGNPNASLMLVGEAPGREEDLKGLPFVGQSGQLLDRMLAAIGRDRSNSYISNTIFWRPPGNRKPTPLENMVCLPFIRKHIELVQPKVLVMVGGTSAGTLLDSQIGITRLRGRWKTFETSKISIPALPIFHPAYLLRQPALKGLVWQDLLALKAKLEEVEA